MLLPSRAVERVWGRTTLPRGFEGFATGQPIGEIWHEDPRGEADLLAKHLFTSERLSIQVHPDGSAARAIGLPRGKDEAWLVLDAKPGAVIGLGLQRAVTREELRAAALDGSIEQLIDWRPVSAGDFFYSPAGTVHAIGAGLSVLEIQENTDLTYRLYDYGRPRELHLDEGIAVAAPEPWRPQEGRPYHLPGRTILTDGGAFVVERWEGASTELFRPGSEPVLLVPINGEMQLDGCSVSPGTVCSSAGWAQLDLLEDASVLVAYAGGDVRRDICA